MANGTESGGFYGVEFSFLCGTEVNFDVRFATNVECFARKTDDHVSADRYVCGAWSRAAVTLN
jgi:hypothetical protein